MRKMSLLEQYGSGPSAVQAQSEFLLTAMSSGSGKTTVTCALLELLKRTGHNPAAFKCGPDYIDPRFHRSVLGLDSRNLDLYLMGEQAVRLSYAAHCADHDVAVVEGVMGYYDGIGYGTDASSWELADALDVSSVLVVRPKGAGITLAAQIAGMQAFAEQRGGESRIKGILLNDCRPMAATALARCLERETGLPVYGFLPHVDDAVLSSRHLGLIGAEEIPDLTKKVGLLADALQENLELDTLLSDTRNEERAVLLTTEPQDRVRKAVIAIAWDEAFRFFYPDSLDLLWNAGADLYFFSPLHDDALPEAATGIYLPGGYPELYAKELSENTSMRTSVRNAVWNGMPTVAECGGFLYLQGSLEGYPMAGAIPGEGYRTDHPVRFGYADLQAEEDSLLFRKGESCSAHSFHYYESTEPGNTLTAVKPGNGRTWRTGVATPSLYAAFEHMHFMRSPVMAERFLQAAIGYAEKREQ